MTVTSNIFLNATGGAQTAWAASTAYTVGQRRLNGGNAYECITAGTSAGSGGPTTTVADITDGTAHWKYLAVAHYTSVASWVASIPATLTENIVVQFWKPSATSGEISVTAGTDASAWMSLSGKTAGSFTTTLRAAPSESFKDGGDKALNYNVANGVAIRNTSTGYSQTLSISILNVIVSGLQFKHNGSGDSRNTCIGQNNAGLIKFENCIVTGTSSGTNGSLLRSISGAGYSLTNCLVVDTGTGVSVFAGNVLAGGAINCTLYGVSGSTAFYSTYASIAVKNSIIMNYSTAFFRNGGSGITSTTNCTSAATLGTGITDTGSLFSRAAADVFVDPAVDFRQKVGSPTINAGTNDGSVTADIFGTVRG